MKSQTSHTGRLIAAMLASIGLPGASLMPKSGFNGPTSARHGKKGVYGEGLRKHFAGKQRERLQKIKVGVLRDEHGSYTVTGRDPITGQQSRKWLAGISAQRGY